MTASATCVPAAPAWARGPSVGRQPRRRRMRGHVQRWATIHESPAGVAQLAEQPSCKRQVSGSIPLTGSTSRPEPNVLSARASMSAPVTRSASDDADRRGSGAVHCQACRHVRCSAADHRRPGLHDGRPGRDQHAAGLHPVGRPLACNDARRASRQVAAPWRLRCSARFWPTGRPSCTARAVSPLTAATIAAAAAATELRISTRRPEGAAHISSH
jgi:hypothetical protein